MEEKYYSQEFDTLLNKIDIYNRFPFLPFVGSNYSKSKIKILYLGESHYLPIDVTNKTPVDDSWYHKQLSDFKLNDEAKRWLSPRLIIDESVIKSNKQNKSHSIFTNIGKEMSNIYKLENYNEAMKTISFYNYFLRPAELKGKSIKNTIKDDKFAFKHLIKMNGILKPDAIIFASRKAFIAFHSSLKNGNDTINEIVNKIYSIPHPGCRWWNKKSKSYAFNNSGPLTGKEKFQEVLRTLI